MSEAGDSARAEARPLVLLANDDGVFAPNLLALRDELAKTADVIVCAPEANQSATSHSLTLNRILRLRKVKEDVFAVDGTPADCVYVALHASTRVLPRRPDLVVSGMNHGLNLGVDVFYSGTVAAAREAAIRGLPAIALSADRNASRPKAAEVGAKLAFAVLDLARAREATLEAHRASDAKDRGLLLNVNFPPGDAWPVRATRIGRRLYSEDVDFRFDPRGGEYLWIGGSSVRHDQLPGSDTEAYDEGVVGITPLTLDLTAETLGDVAALVARAG